jgi:uncharacterized protein with HEPN domain
MRLEELYLQDIVESVNAIERFLKNVREEDFLSNELVQSAVSYKLTIIGEAAAHISDKLKNRYPQVEWKEIIGFRNFAVHVYFAVNWKIVWTTATEDIAVLKKQILEILQNDFPDFAPASDS